MINNIKYNFLMWLYKGDTQKEIDINLGSGFDIILLFLKYDPLKLLK